jgi:hypothetical protein
VNFKKVLIAVAAAVVLIAGWQMLTRVDRSNPIAVGNAFTKALKAGDTAKASGYLVPEHSAAWRTTADDKIHSMRSGTLERFYENIPSSPAFTSTSGAVATSATLKSADNSFALEMVQVNGKWYVAKSPL